MPSVTIDTVECSILRDGGSGQIEGTSDGTISATVVYKCLWADWQRVWAALLGYPEPPELIGPSRDPHPHPVYPEIICYRATIDGIGVASNADDMIQFEEAVVTALYGIPPSSGGFTIYDPPPGEIEDVTYGQVRMLTGVELMTEDSRTYKWAETRIQSISPPQHRIVRRVPWIQYVFSLTNFNPTVAQFNAAKFAHGYVNTDTWNGCEPGHLLFEGMEASQLRTAPSSLPEMVLSFKERVEAPWNYMWNPNAFNGTADPYNGTQWHEIAPHPYPSKAFAVIFNPLLRP